MNKLFIGIMCVLLLTGCGTYEEGDIIDNEPLLINIDVEVAGALTDEDTIKMNDTNSSLINDTSG